MDILAGKKAWLNAIARRARLHIAQGSLNRFAHNLAELTGCFDLPLTGHRNCLDGEQFAADFCPS